MHKFYLFSFVLLFSLAYSCILDLSEGLAKDTALTNAINAAQNREYGEAISILQTEIAKDSSDFRLYKKLADFYSLSKTENEGIDFFEQAIKQNPLEPNNYAGLAMLYNLQKNETQGFANSEKALELGNNSHSILALFIESGVTLNKSGDLSKTLRGLRESQTQESFYELGYTLWRIKIRNYNRAQATISEFLEMNDKHGFGYKLAGDIAQAESNNSEAIKNYLRAEKYLDNSEEKIKNELLSELGTVYFKKGLTDSAEFYYKKSLEFAETNLLIPHFIESVKKITSFYRNQNEIQNLINTLSSNQELFLQNVDSAAKLNFIHELAEAHYESGDIFKAFDVYSSALNIAEKLNNTEKQAEIFYVMGLYYQQLSQTEKAQDFFNKSITAAEKANLSDLEHQAAFELGKIYAELGDREAAKKNFTNVLRHAQRKQQLTQIEESFLHLAHLYLQQPTDLRSVYYYLNMADAMARQTFQLHFAANHRWVQGLVALLEDDVETAETYFLHSIKIGKESGSYLSRLAGKSGLIKVYLHTNFSNMACSYADSALTFLKDYYTFCSEEYSADFFDLKKDLIMPALMAYSSVGDLEKIYDTIELYKAVTHYKKLNQIKQKINDDTALTIKLKLNEKAGQINEKWRELWTISRNRNEYLETAFRIKNEIQALHKERKEYLKGVSKRFPQYYPIFSPVTVPLNELQNALKQNKSRFVHYFIGDVATFIIVVSGNDINCQRVNVNRTIMENLIYKVSPLYSTEKNNFSMLYDSNVSPFSLEQAGKLYKFLFQPIEPWLDTNETIIISKDATLNRVPFEALVLNSDSLIDELDFSNANFLVEKYAISYLPSAFFLDLVQKEAGDTQKLFGLFASTEVPNEEDGVNGQPAKKRTQKLKRVQNFQKFLEPFGEAKSALYLNKDANRKNFVDESTQFQILQINLPASLYEDFPFLSGFTFADQQDFFAAYELFNQPINSDIFVLADAEVKLSTGDNNLAANGFFHALTFTGVPTFVTTLWRQYPSDINSISEILLGFENNLHLGLTKAKALQQAKIEYLKTNRINPSYWASLVMYGDAGAFDFKETQTTRWVLWFSVLAVLTLCVFLGMQLRKVFREK